MVSDKFRSFFFELEFTALKTVVANIFVQQTSSCALLGGVCMTPGAKPKQQVGPEIKCVIQNKHQLCVFTVFIKLTFYPLNYVARQGKLP